MNDWSCYKDHIPLNLFTVCRLIHDEINTMFYSLNRFRISRQALYGLKALENLTDTTLSKIRFLYIGLYLGPCDTAVCCKSRRRKDNNLKSCWRKHDLHLSHRLKWVQQWERICFRLSRYVQADELALYVICDCGNVQTAEMIIKPLLELPILQDCAIRLARPYKSELQALAKNTVLQLTGRSDPTSSLSTFPFLDLPKEIQINILESALVTNKEIICSQNEMLFPGHCLTEGMVAKSTEQNRHFLKCFCCKGHLAYNFKCVNECKDLGFPSALFLTSPLLPCKEIFYGKNTFVVRMTERFTSPDDVAIVEGLSRFPGSSLEFLTDLRLHFPPPDAFTGTLSFLSQNAPREGWNNWLKTLDLLSSKANLSVLNLELQFEEIWYIAPDFVEEEVEPGQRYEKLMSETYERFLEPVKKLKGLKNFLVNMHWEMRDEPIGDEVEDRMELERRLERMVMGREYDAWGCRKKVRAEYEYASH